MRKVMQLLFLPILFSFFISCEKEPSGSNDSATQAGTVTGKVTDSKGSPLAGVEIVIEHTVWAGTYVYATTDANGYYKAVLPIEPAGSWAAKAQLIRTAYGQDYTFDLAVDKAGTFKNNAATVRNFTWKLNGQKPDASGYYGAHADVYQWGTDVPMTEVKLIFTPNDASDTLIDGSAVPVIERKLEDVGGTFMIKDIPIGRYSVKAVYPGRALLLKNRH
ncbi:MAG TPA: carboxypeptidase-like regulatory domain-containing protein, partial [Niastella sp.]|nr:carboxypeptidase-like regulatory domain-containing protein [Niastella sp.]